VSGNVVEIVIRARTSVREGFDQARKEAEEAGVDSGESYTDRFVGTFATRVRQRIAAPMARVGDEIGERLGEGTARGIAQVVARGIAAIPEAVGDEAERAGEELGERLGEGAGRETTKRVRDHMGRFVSQTSSESERAGSEIGDRIGTRIRDRILTRIREALGRAPKDGVGTRSGGIPGGDGDSDKDTDRNLIGRMLDRGREAAKAFSTGFGQAVSTFFSGDLISMLIKILVGGAFATALAVPLGAAITSAVLLGVGGGVLAAGIASAFKDPKVTAEADKLKTKLGKMFEEFGKPFRGPVATFLEKVSDLADRLAPKLGRLSEIMAPLVDKLGDGFIGMIEKAMPGILKAAEESAPLFETLAEHMPKIGEALGKFFDKIADQGDDANLFFDDLLTLIEKLIPLIGDFIATLTSAYDKVDTFGQGVYRVFTFIDETLEKMVRGAKKSFLQFQLIALDAFGVILAGAARALSWIPGIGPKLKGAERKFNEFRRDINNELKKIHDRDVRIRFHVFGIESVNAAIDIGRQLQGMAAGGIKGAANGSTSSGLTLVGEHGPELAQIQPGGRVYSNPDTQRMLAGMGGGGRGAEELVARWETTGDAFLDALAKSIRVIVKNSGNSIDNAFSVGG
jgi:hypothetical protein